MHGPCLNTETLEDVSLTTPGENSAVIKLDLEEGVKNYELFELHRSIIHSVLVTLKMIDSKSPCNSVRHQQVFLLLMYHS